MKRSKGDKHLQPIMGDEWSRLWTIVGKLASGQKDARRSLNYPLASGEVTLTKDEAAWLCELLNAAGTGEDVSRRFVLSVSNRPRDRSAMHAWIAFDVARLEADLGSQKAAHEAAAERWPMSADSIRDMLKKPDKQFPRWPIDVRVIDWHRAKLTGKK